MTDKPCTCLGLPMGPGQTCNAHRQAATDLGAGSMFIDPTQIQTAHFAPMPVISACGDNGLIWAVHPDGRIELGDGYSPDEAAAAFWEAVQRLQPTLAEREFGPHLHARINQHLKAGEEAERKVKRLDEMAQTWKENLLETIRRDTVVDAIHHVTRGDQ